ncbi:MAG: hypothetical protein GAK43_01812 [Stenotrophomonas maltophilia]|nr:MAG: hypothetical protein GAK43_01812 [Stenotrophomonas maltophilia]
MQYDGLAWAFALIALLALLVAARVLYDRHWFLGWLRGSIGLGLVGLALLIGLLAWDLRSYAPIPAERPLATLSFHRLSPQVFSVRIAEGASERSIELPGDLWQLDVRVLKWHGLAALVGLTPGYRLQALSGRYLTLEQSALGRTLNLAPSSTLDLWAWLHEGGHDLLTFQPEAGQVSFMPMADDAVYVVNYGPIGLKAEPLNQAAVQALREWR